VQNNGIDIQDTVNRDLLEMSRRLSIPLVASNDCHYLNSEDARPTTPFCVSRRGKPSMIPADFVSVPTSSISSPKEEMDRLFQVDFIRVPWKTPCDIAERCHIDFDFNTYHFPQFSASEPHVPKPVRSANRCVRASSASGRLIRQQESGCR
jgi:DNA polymerase-3 subunit alpha